MLWNITDEQVSCRWQRKAHGVHKEFKWMQTIINAGLKDPTWQILKTGERYYMQRAVPASSKQRHSNVFVSFFSWFKGFFSEAIYSQYHDCKIFGHRWAQLQIYCKYCGFMRSLWDPESSVMRFQYLMSFETKGSNKVVVLKSRACMC